MMIQHFYDLYLVVGFLCSLALVLSLFGKWQLFFLIWELYKTCSKMKSAKWWINFVKNLYYIFENHYSYSLLWGSEI
jgi:hypothetical protein